MSTIETAEATPPRKRRFRFRKMTWALIAWTGVMALWMFGGAKNVTSAESNAECVDTFEGSLNAADCEALNEVGAGLGVGILFVGWFLGFVVLSLIWFMSRPRQAVVS